MSNTEWKKGFEEGFAAGWKAAKSELNYINFPPVYYASPPTTGVSPTGSYAQTMADTGRHTFGVINNVSDHTIIV